MFNWYLGMENALYVAILPSCIAPLITRQVPSQLAFRFKRRILI